VIKTLGAIILAGAMAWGIGGCEKEVHQVEFDEYKCKQNALGPNYLPTFYGDGYKSEIRVFENDNLIMRYIPATEESCKLCSCGNHLDSSSETPHEWDMAFKLAQKCEQLLEQKYQRGF
jgi:hypothetical protein